jgi:predicted dehydrogenase
MEAAGGVSLLVNKFAHIMDLMRFLAGDARWCFARVGVAGKQRVAPVTKADVREGAEGMGSVAGNHITALYGFDRRAVGHFSTCVDPPSKGARFGLTVHGTRGVLQLTTGSLPAVYFLPDPSWFPGRSRLAWQEVTSTGLGKPETLKDTTLHAGNVRIARDLIEAVERDRQPKGSVYDGRAALEMILAVYESHRLRGPADLPLKNRRHPLTML